MRILLTGGAGFIGSHFAEAMIADGYMVDCLDNFNDYYDPAIKRNNVKSLLTNDHYKLIKGDITDNQFIDNHFKNNSYDTVVHLAARAGVRPSIKSPLLYERVNVQGTMHLLEQCKLHGIRKFIFASSSSVYGTNKKVPFSEDDNVDNPISPYAATKKAGELICYTYHRLFGISVTCLRFFTAYGPRQRPDMAIHKFAWLIHSGQSVPVFGDGSSKRDYTYIDDIVQGLYAAVSRCDGYRIYNLGESKTVNLGYLLDLLQDALGKKAILEYCPEQPGDVPMTYADIRRAKTELDYNPKTSIEDGMPKFIEWFRQVYP